MNSLIVRSTDRGVTWEIQHLPLAPTNNDRTLIASRAGPLVIAVGRYVLREAAGGWEAIRIPNTSKYSRVLAVRSDTSSAALLVYNYDSCCDPPPRRPSPANPGGQAFLQSSDGQLALWHHEDLPERCLTVDMGTILDVYDVRSVVACRIFSKGNAIRAELYFKHGSTSWQRLDQDARSFSNVRLLPNGDVLATSGSGSFKEMCRYGDTGKICTDLGTPIRHVDVSPDGTTRLAKGNELMLLDANGNWVTIYTSAQVIGGIAFASDSVGVMLSNTLLRTEDGGRTWQTTSVQVSSLLEENRYVTR